MSAIPNPWTRVVLLAGGAGTASALKMCTASMHKGTNALIMQALPTAAAHGVVDEFFADVAHAWPERVPSWHLDIALAASKSSRFADEMREIAGTQAEVGLPAALFEGIAAVYERASRTPLGQTDPADVPRTATVGQVLDGLREDPHQ